MSADSIVFDCDGVLVDIRGSYDRAIDVTCGIMSRRLGAEPVPVGGEAIAAFKASGGFNDEVDLTYAAILCMCAAGRAGRDPAGLMAEAARRADRTGIESVQRYVSSLCDMSDIESRLGRLGDRHDNPVYRTFDEVFYGAELYRSIFGRDPEVASEGMIKNDVVLLTEDLLKRLQGRFGRKMALVTGRGMASAGHALGPLMGYFDVPSSAFLEDEPRSMAKPSPEALLRALSSMGSDKCLYVGDSMEDLMMARGASERGVQARFCAITGTAPDPAGRRRMFEEAGADVILGSIDEIPAELGLP